MSEPLIGVVNVAGKAFTVSEMPTAAEQRLGLLLRQMYERQSGTPYARARDMIEEMPTGYRPWAIAECTRAKVANELPGAEARELARGTPEGVALELYMRARKHHPGLTHEECKAVVNEVNCLDVLSDMIERLTPEDKDSPKS